MTDEPEQPEVPEGAAVFPLIPAELGVHPLLLATLHTVVFLDGSEADVVDPDAANEAMEYIVTYLQRIGGPQLQQLREDLEVLTSYARQQGWPKQQMRFLKEFLSDYGIGEEGKA